MEGNERDLEGVLAQLLHYGTYIAAVIITLGWLGSAFAGFPSGNSIINIGVLILLLLPVIRLCVMAFVFLRQRRFSLSAVSIAVLAIICVSFLCGLYKKGKL